MNKDNLSRAGLTILIILTILLSVAYVKNLADNQEVKIIKVPVPETPTFEALLDAIEYVESGGDWEAIGPNDEVGNFQLTKIYVDDVNRIQRISHNDKYSVYHPWKYYHRKNPACSRWMVRTYIKYYSGKIGKEATFEDMARIHNGGPDGWKKESTKVYWEKVKRAIEGE